MSPIKILLFSDYNPFSLSLIARLDKEGHQVFVVTGSSISKRRKPRAVFQEYNFAYDSDSLPHIIKNVDPEIAIFGGALASLSCYVAGLTNIMISLKDVTIKQFIYISSLTVFSGNHDLLIDEQTKANPITSRDQTILLGEKICVEYSIGKNYPVNIIRFSEVYGTYKKDYLEENICAEICQHIIQNETIELTENKQHHLLYVDDAVDGLYKVMTHENKKDEIYHIANDDTNTYLEIELIELLKDKYSDDIEVQVLKQQDNKPNPTYITDKIKKLNFQEKYQVANKINELYRVIKKDNKTPILARSDRESVLGRLFKLDGKVKDKVLPYAENILFFIFLNIFIYVTRTLSFHEVVDVYLLYVVMISLIYGFEQSVFTVIMSVLAKIYITIYSDIEALTLVNEYMYMWILFIFTIGVSVGYLKEQYKVKYSDMTDENKYLEGQLQDIKEINAINSDIKELYESRLLNYTDSFGKIHEITSALDLVEPQAIIFRAIRVIQQIMSTEEVSIYISSGNNRFFRLIASSANPARNLSASLKTSEYIRVFEKMERKEIYVNTDLDPHYPMMAGGIYKNGHLQSIVMIWSLPFENNNLYQMNTFEITCRLIESKLNVAYEYMSNIGSSYQFKYDNMLDQHSFEKVRELYHLGLEEGIAKYSLLEIEKDPAMTQDAFIDRIKKNIRETDYMYDNPQTTKILLTNTDKKDARYVINRLKYDGILVGEGGVIE